MADVIKTIGASGSGADYPNYQTFFAARVGGAGDRYIGDVITATGGLSTGLATTGNFAMEIVIRAGTGLEFDPENPTAPHAIISAGGGINMPATGTAKLTLENIEVRGTNTSPTTPLINTGAAVADVTIRGCWLRGGRHGCQNAISGSTLLIENSIVEDAYRAGVHLTFAGVTARNVVIANCNKEAGTTASYCGMRKDVAGTVIENVVAYNNGTDFFGATTKATVSYMASGGATASGTGALTGVTSAAFTDYAGDIFTAATGGVLDGTGPSGNDRGIVTDSNPTILLINPAANVFLARDKDTNTGNIAVNGTCTDLTAGATIEARFNGGSWQVIDATPTGTFSGTLTGAAVGVGAVEVRVSNFVAATDSHAGIAVGAKFLFWGQSNFSGRANNAQTYTGPAGWWRKRAVESNTQVVATADPFDTYTVNGSIFPLLANHLTTALECPVLFIGVAAGGTSLSQWQPGQSLNTRMLTFYAAESPTGHVEAVATWIGEGDSVLETAETDFKSRYNVVIDQLKALTGANSMLVAISGENTTPYANVRQWIKDIAATSANVSDVVPEIWPLYQKIHYETDTETALAADAVFDGLMSSFYVVPSPELAVAVQTRSTAAAQATTQVRMADVLSATATATPSLSSQIRFGAQLTGVASMTAAFGTPAGTGDIAVTLSTQSSLYATLLEQIQLATLAKSSATLTATIAGSAARMAAQLKNKSAVYSSFQAYKQVSFDVIGIPDGSYHTFVRDHISHEVLYDADATYSAQQLTLYVNAQSGDKVSGYVIDRLNPAENGAVLYGLVS